MSIYIYTLITQVQTEGKTLVGQFQNSRSNSPQKTFLFKLHSN